jgi:hypothetical protein
VPLINAEPPVGATLGCHVPVAVFGVQSMIGSHAVT